MARNYLGWLDRRCGSDCKTFLAGVWYDTQKEEEEEEGDNSRSSDDGRDVCDSESDASDCDEDRDYGEDVDYGNEGKGR